MKKYVFSFCIMLIFSATQLSAQDAKTALNDLEKYITDKEWRIKSLEVKDDIFYFHFNEDFTSFPILEADDQVTQIDRGIKIHCKNDEKCVNWFNMYVTSYKLESDYYEPVKLVQLFNNFLKAYRDEKNGITKPLPEKPIATRVYNKFDKVKVTAINMNNDWNPKKINDANEVLNKTFILLENTPPNKYGTYRCNFLGKNGKLLYLEDVNLEPSSEVSVSDIAFNTQQYPTITTTSDIYLPKGTHVLVYFMGVSSVTNISEETTKTILGKPGVLNKDILKSALYDEYASYTVDITLDGTGKQFSINSAKCIALQSIVYKEPEKKTNTYQTSQSTTPSTTYENTQSESVKELLEFQKFADEIRKATQEKNYNSSTTTSQETVTLTFKYRYRFSNKYDARNTKIKIFNNGKTLGESVAKMEYEGNQVSITIPKGVVGVYAKVYAFRDGIWEPYTARFKYPVNSCVYIQKDWQRDEIFDLYFDLDNQYVTINNKDYPCPGYYEKSYYDEDGDKQTIGYDEEHDVIVDPNSYTPFYSK